MKTLYMMVGPQGSGKTTLFNEEFSKLDNIVRISQDDQGKQQHFVLFMQAISQGKNIYLDRINHTREQREKYLKPAKDANYLVKIIVLQESYAVCRKRILERKDHPTLKSENVDDALSMYFFQYQPPQSRESNNIEYRGTDKQFLLDLTDKCKDKRVFIVGDLHGMYDEFVELLTQADYSPTSDVLIFCGDLVDRGPKIDQCLSWLSSVNESYSVMGNHEYKFVRYLLGRKVHSKSLLATTEQTKNWNKNTLIPLIMSMPYTIKFRDNAYVVHAGINPLKPINRQYKDELMYTRNCTIGETTAPWWKFYYGDDEIYFGHEVTPQGIQVADKVFAMDGGACFGMELRLCVSNPDGTKNFFFQKAHKAYADYRDDGYETSEPDQNRLEPYEEKVRERINFKESL